MMKTADFSEIPPLVLLLNEIDILLAQARLLELHVKRAQALSGNRIAELKQEHALELSALRSDLAQSLGEQAELRQALETLNQQLPAERQRSEEQLSEIGRTEVEPSELSRHVAVSEETVIAARNPEENLESRAEGDAAELESSDRERQWKERLADLEGRLREAGQRAQEADTARERALQENSALHCRLAELEVLEGEAARRAQQELAETCLALERETAARERLLDEQQMAAQEREQALQARLIEQQKELERVRASLEAAEVRLLHDTSRAAELETLSKELVAEVQRLHGDRRSREDEIEELRHQVSRKERELTGRFEAVTAIELTLHAKIQSLQQTLAGLHHEIKGRDRALEHAGSEIAELRRELEHAVSERPTLTDALHQAEIRAAIEQEERARVEAKLAEMRLSLAEKQLLADRRAAEIADLKDAAFHRSALEDFATIASQEHFAMTTDEPDSKPRRPDPEPENTVPQSVSEQALREEIVCLRREAQERNRILQDRNDELVRVKLQLDQLQERLTQLESAAASAAAADPDTERMRTEFQAQVALLQAELSQKEWAFEERQAETRSLEQRLRQEIDQLRRQPALHAADPGGVPVAPGVSEGASSQAPILSNGSDDQASFGRFAKQRRWSGNFDRKRRWRSGV